MKPGKLLILLMLCFALCGCGAQSAVPGPSGSVSGSESSLVSDAASESSGEESSQPETHESSLSESSLSGDSPAEESSGAESEPLSSTSEESSDEQSMTGESSLEEISHEESSREESKSSVPEKPKEQSSAPAPVEPAPAESSAPAPKDVTGITLSRSELTMTVGDSYDLDIYFTPADADKRDFVWEWTDTSLADMNGDGLIRAKAPGSLTVTARTYNGKTAACQVTIKEKPAPAPEPSQVSRTESPRTDIVNYNTPYNSDTLYRDVDSLCKRYSGIMYRFSIGSSEKGRDIPCIVLGKGSKEALIVGGIHSREHITVSFVMRSLEAMAKAYTKNREYGEYNVRELLNKYTLYIVPMCNPDGTNISTAGDKPLVNIWYSPDNYKHNANGVNLNRNFPFYWEERFAHQTTSPGDEIYAGKKAASESETKALMALCAQHNFNWLLDMHIVGNGIFWSDSTNGRVPDDERLANALAGRCGLTAFSMTMTQVNGGFENWFRYAYKRPGLCIELVPYSQSSRVPTYIGLNSIFDDAVVWRRTKYIFLEAMKTM